VHIWPLLDAQYTALADNWGTEVAKQKLKITIHVTGKDKEGNQLLLETIADSNLYRDQKKSVRFKRPDFDEIMEETLLQHIQDDDNTGNEHEDFRMLPTPAIHYNRPLPINVHLIV
jgi:hypothetical protein